MAASFGTPVWGSHSMTVLCTTAVDTPAAITNALLVTGAVAGPLKTFLNATTYADAAACATAFRAQKGTITLTTQSGTPATSVPVVLWVASAGVAPSFTITQAGTTNAVYEMQLAMHWSGQG